MKGRVWFALFSCIIGSAVACQSGSCSPDSQVSSSVLLNATPDQVWQALTIERLQPSEHRKVLSHKGVDSVISEEFQHLPMLGTASCTYTEHEVPNSSVQYHMVNSDKLKAFEGAWSLRPANNGTQTVLSLSSFTDTMVDIPFKDRLTRNITLSFVNHKLADVKDVVAKQKLEVAANCN